MCPLMPSPLHLAQSNTISSPSCPSPPTLWDSGLLSHPILPISLHPLALRTALSPHLAQLLAPSPLHLAFSSHTPTPHQFHPISLCPHTLSESYSLLPILPNLLVPLYPLSPISPNLLVPCHTLALSCPFHPISLCPLHPHTAALSLIHFTQSPCTLHAPHALSCPFHPISLCPLHPHTAALSLIHFTQSPCTLHAPHALVPLAPSHCCSVSHPFHLISLHPSCSSCPCAHTQCVKWDVTSLILPPIFLNGDEKVHTLLCHNYS